jgi:hypothetical protein
MDLLLSDGSSCCSGGIDTETARDPTVEDSDEGGPSTSTAAGGGGSSVPKRHSKKRKRGSVLVVPSNEAPTDEFQRTVPHRRGHWAGHVLVPMTSTVGVQAVEKSIIAFQKTLERNGHSGTLVRHAHLHLSLSKCFSLQLAFIDSFVNKLAQRIKIERSTKLFVDHREHGGTILVNEEKTRSFLSWKVKANTSLLRIVKHVDSILAEYGMPLYYDPPIFHISLASFAGNLEDLKNIDPAEDHSSSSENGSSSDDEEPCFLVVDHVVCRFGTTKSYTIPLAPS